MLGCVVGVVGWKQGLGGLGGGDRESIGVRRIGGGSGEILKPGDLYRD